MIVVFMVAGMSSRFGGNPKQFAIIGNKETGETLIEYSINQALKAAENICSIDNSSTEVWNFSKTSGCICK